MRSSDYSSSRSDTHTQDDLIGLIHSHTYLHAHAALISLIQHPLQTHFSLLAFPFISFSHTYTHAHTDELCNLSHFLVLPVSCEVRSKPSFAEIIFFYVSVYTHTASHRASLLFSHRFRTGVPTSYSAVFHWPGAHSLNCAKFVQHVFACTQVCKCSCRRLFCICLPCLCELVCNALNMSCICEIKIQVARGFKDEF